jgi:hypothetical protein
VVCCDKEGKKLSLQIRRGKFLNIMARSLVLG